MALSPPHLLELDAEAPQRLEALLHLEGDGILAEELRHLLLHLLQVAHGRLEAVQIFRSLLERENVHVEERFALEYCNPYSHW